MGDRGNIVIRDGQANAMADVYLYTHWRGSEVQAVAQRALAKRWRWNDSEYLARIVFDVLLDGDHNSETGFGISTRLCDNEHPIVILDVEHQRVSVHHEAHGEIGAEIKSWSFEEFASAPAEEIVGADS